MISSIMGFDLILKVSANVTVTLMPHVYESVPSFYIVYNVKAILIPFWRILKSLMVWLRAVCVGLTKKSIAVWKYVSNFSSISQIQYKCISKSIASLRPASFYGGFWSN